MHVIQYNLTSECLCIGERVKGGVYKPSAKTIPYSQIRGAIERKLGLTVHAVGVIDSIEGTDHLTIGPKDRSTDIVRLPIKAMYLKGVKGRIFIINENNISNKLGNDITLYMGGLRMKGFGECFLSNKREFEVKEEGFEDGILNTRIPIDVAGVFGITVLKEKLGYLFEPEDEETGKYVLSYFEGSKIKGPEFLLERRSEQCS